MKKKLLIVILVSIFFTFLIYHFNKDEKIYFLSLGDGVAVGMNPFGVRGYGYNDYLLEEFQHRGQLENYVSGFMEVGQRVSDLVIMIENNVETYNKNHKDVSIQHAISKADIITLSIGNDELLGRQNITERDVTKYIDNMKILISKIRELSDKKIYLLSLYSMDGNQQVDVINEELYKMSMDYNISYISVSDLICVDAFLKPESYYFSYQVHREISNAILEDFMSSYK